MYLLPKLPGVLASYWQVPEAARVGLLMQNVRAACTLSQAQLGGRAGVSQHSVSRFERGAGNPSTATIERLFASSGLNAQHSHRRRHHAAVVVRRGSFEVIGKSSVVVIDAREATVDRAAPGALTSFSQSGSRLPAKSFTKEFSAESGNPPSSGIAE